LIPGLKRRLLRSAVANNRFDPPLSVLHVITGLGVGGAESVLVNLAVSGRDPSRPTAVVALVADGPNRQKLEAVGVHVFDVGMRRGRPNFLAVFRLARVIRETRPAFVQSWMYHADLISLISLWFSGRRSKTRLLWSIRCSNMDTRQYKPQFSAIVRAWALLARFADAVIANSDAGVAAHRALGFRPRFLAVVKNGIDTDLFRPNSSARVEVRRQLGIADDAVVIATVGRVDPMKDHDLFLRVMARLDGITGLAIGLGTEALPDRARLLRLGQRDDVPQLLAASDILVSMSRFGEGFSNVVAEAMSCGLPVVATDVGDARRIIGKTGLVVSAGDEQGLVDALHRLVANTALRQRLGRAARQRVEADFGLDRMAAAFSAVYETLQSRETAPVSQREPLR
jgi:glycosyltransferase involved in cell wall biosynthesis